MSLIKTPLNSTSYWFIDSFKLVFLLGLFYSVWIGSYALFTPDEGRYSEVAREMVVTGDYITPRLNGVVFLDKPILYYWLQVLAIHLFGLKEWALRFWPVCLGVFGCLVTYLSGRYLFNRRTGVLSAIILATSPLYYGGAHYANLDLEVAVWVSSSLLFFLMGMRSPNKKEKKIFFALAYVFSALAFLTKGLIGLAFPIMIIGTWVLILNKWQSIKTMHLLLGLMIFCIITVPWYVLVQRANPEFLEFFFLKQQVSRFLTTDHFNNRTTGTFYIPIILSGVFPWCIFLFQAFWFNIKRIFESPKDHAAKLFLVIWVVLIFGFFSIPKSKTVGYILPIFPPLALLFGIYLDQYWDRIEAKSIRLGIFGYIILSTGIIIFSLFGPKISYFNILPTLTPYLKINALLFFISALVLVILLSRKKQLPSFFLILTLTSGAFLWLIAASAPVLNHKSIKPLAMEIKPILQNNDEIVTFYKYYQDLPIYLERQITVVENWTASDIPLHDNWVRELWYGMSLQNTQNWLIDEKSFWQRWYSNKRLFVFTEKSQYKKLIQKSKTPVYKIAEFNRTILFSNQPTLTKNPQFSQNESQQRQNS